MPLLISTWLNSNPRGKFKLLEKEVQIARERKDKFKIMLVVKQFFHDQTVANRPELFEFVDGFDRNYGLVCKFPKPIFSGKLWHHKKARVHQTEMGLYQTI